MEIGAGREGVEGEERFGSPEVERVVRAPSALDRIQDELDGVERALARVDDGGYGTCQACGAEIPDERLATEPVARFCAEHQAASGQI